MSLTTLNNKKMVNLLLADDDMDDCLFFQEALEELSMAANLSTVNDGVQLMDFLKAAIALPDALFLDLNMPRKSGFECLTELKDNNSFKEIPIIIFSTSLDPEVVNKLYNNGAHYYIRKPGDFNILKRVIEEATSRISKNKSQRPERIDFIIKS
ncbi:Response regulator receiver domain-containing protein [Flavobacterium micromati]|uniref:Response regulator receiver domain-containing protein n=2 Tax=Flavobacterium micromati TaxID=229205 RepID=A0A1M5IRQ8_9FLAO|nr:Response regulator receiver domain-containing protein [Flavobacterium micromati]